MGFPIRDDDDRPVARTDETGDTGASRKALVFSFATFIDAQATVVCARAGVFSTQAELFGFVRRLEPPIEWRSQPTRSRQPGPDQRRQDPMR